MPRLFQELMNIATVGMLPGYRPFKMDSTRNVASHGKKVKKRNRARVLSNEDDTCCLKLMNYFT